MIEVEVKVFDMIKFSPNKKIIQDETYQVEKYEVKKIPVDEIEDRESVDEFNHYLILTFEDGSTKRFKSSHCHFYTDEEYEEDDFDDEDLWREDDFE